MSKKMLAIKLSLPEKEVMLPKFDKASQAVVKVKESLRSCEKLALDSMVGAASSLQSDFKHYNECLDIRGQLDNLADTDDLLLTKEDHKYLEAGFKATTGNRPNGWEACVDLFLSLETPAEVEVAVEDPETPVIEPVE